MMIVIYKITSPACRAYIGQTKDVKKRWSTYRRPNCVYRQPLLQRSLLKYGSENHAFEIVHELPNDVSKEVIDNYESFYIDQYKECGVLMLNLKGGGARGALSEESINKLKNTKKQKPYRHSEVALAKMREKRKSYKVTNETKLKISQALKGQQAHNKGVPHSEEHRQKISIGNKGRTPSEKSINALIERNKKRTGFTPWNKGKEWSEEAKTKMSNAHKGKKLSKESIQKRTLTRYGKMPKSS